MRVVPGALLLLVLVSCTASKPPAVAAGPASTNPLDRSVGLELRRWEVAAEPAEIGELLRAHADDGAVTPALVDAFARNGMTLVRVRLDRLDALRRALAPISLDVMAWHGQVFRWRPVFGAPIGPGPRAVAMDGRVVRFEPGDLQLLCRSWVVPMEDGPLLELELVPRLQRPAGSGPASLGAARSAPGRLLPNLAADLSLRAGWVHVLSGAAPQERGGGLDSSSGPVADAPISVGELLFHREGPPKASVVLVFVPQLGQPSTNR